MKQDLLDLTIEDMMRLAAELGEKPYRGKQLFKWIYGSSDEKKKGGAGPCGKKDRGGADPEEGASGIFGRMTNLPKAFREKLEEQTVPGRVSIAEVMEDKKDGTRKFLFRISSEYVEGVLMKYKYGNTLCLSSQIGCRMGCAFCASALGGFVRNLTAGEMMGQLLEGERCSGEKVDHIVVMGMGEPFDNYDNLSRFLNLLHDPEGRNMSWRNMTVSTSGIIPGIVAFAEDFPQVNLAISLHRTDDESRSRLMPVNRKYPIKDLLEAARHYTEKTHRRITFEYALIEGENDSDRDGDALAGLLRGMLCHVNLIPLNKVEEIGMEGSSRKRAMEFADKLTSRGIPATVRRQLGDEIQGACGQLKLHRT